MTMISEFRGAMQSRALSPIVPIWWPGKRVAELVRPGWCAGVG